MVLGGEEMKSGKKTLMFLLILFAMTFALMGNDEVLAKVRFNRTSKTIIKGKSYTVKISGVKLKKIKKVKLTPETEEFFKNCKMDIDWSHVREHQGKLFYLKEDIPEMKKVRVLRKGLYLGEMKKGRFEPSQSFAVALAANEYEPYLSFDINDENTVKYLKCETLDVDTNTEGIHLVGTNEFPLGWAKIKKGRLKNKYSSSWRWL